MRSAPTSTATSAAPTAAWAPGRRRSGRARSSQAEMFVKTWKTNAQLKGEEPLPFDYSKELVGGRAPCLEGQRNLIPAAKEMGFRYDASSVGGRQIWPQQIDDIWDFPLQQIPVPGRNFETLSMDYNFLANQSGTTKGDPSMHAAWGNQMRDGLLQRLRARLQGQPGAALHRQPLRVLERRDLHEGRRGHHQDGLPRTGRPVCQLQAADGLAGRAGPGCPRQTARPARWARPRREAGRGT